MSQLKTCLTQFSLKPTAIIKAWYRSKKSLNKKSKQEMPLFGKKHKSPRRKLEAGASNTLKSSLGLPEHSADPNDPNNPVKLRLGGNELVFQDGEWYSDTTPAAGGKSSAEVNKLQKQNTQLKEENNYLKYKIDVLLDMLAATTADCKVIEKELDTLQSQKRTRSMQR